MLYRTVMVVGVLALAWSATWFYRVSTGLEQLHVEDVVPMVLGGAAGGLAACRFVPWLGRREARRRQAG